MKLSWNLLSPRAEAFKTVEGISRQEFMNSLIVFLISPALAIIPAVRKFHSRYSRLLLVIFIGLFGFHMVFSRTSDGTRHKESLNQYESKTWGDFFGEAWSIVQLKPVEIRPRFDQEDLYLHALTFAVSRFTTDGRWMFMVVGLVYGFFYITGIQRIHRLIQGKLDFTLINLFILFVLWRSLDGMSGIRFFTGTWVLFNGAAGFFETGKKRHLALALSAPLFHVGHFLTAPALLVVVFAGIRPLLYTGLFLASFTFTFIEVGTFKELASTTEVGEAKMDDYISEDVQVDYFQARGRQSFHARWSQTAGKAVITILFLFSIFATGYLKRLPGDRMVLGLASYGLILMTISNMAYFSFAINLRVMITAGLFILSYLILNYDLLRTYPPFKSRAQLFRLLTLILLPASGLFIFTQLSMVGDFVDLRVALSPFLYPFLGDEPIAAKELIRNLIN